jgi:hypothetical protein
MEKKINLEEIIQECVGIMVGAKNTTPMDYGECKFILKYFGEKLLELASENATICKEYTMIFASPKTVVNKQSILNTINQVE